MDPNASPGQNPPQLTIALDPDQQAQVASWQDGQNYQITVEQTGPGAFSLVSIDSDAASSPDEPAPDDESDAGMPGGVGAQMAAGTGTMGTTIPSPNPVDRLVMAKRGR